VNERKHLLPLDGVRGLAILMVFVYHYAVGGINSNFWLVRTVGEISEIGWSGVDLFFVLSGFLITGILYDTQHKEGYYTKFYARRTLRIFPIYYLFIAICVLIVPFYYWRPAHAFFLIYLGYPAALIWPALDRIPVRITHLWSLSIEEQFYFVWPWLIKKLRSKTNILKLCWVVFFSALLFRVIFSKFVGWDYVFILCRMDGLAVGAALAILLRMQIRINGLILFSIGTVPLVILILLRHTIDRHDYWVITIGFSLIAIAYGGLLILALGPLSKFFRNLLLRIFGKYSYGLYLYHLPLFPLLTKLKLWIHSLPLYFLGCLAINLAVAAFSFHVIEQPILRLKERFSYE
jgi:peptidoglycan/LPS O-acetylase OafA/YrhL